jgi:hypothetical protein
MRVAVMRVRIAPLALLVSAALSQQCGPSARQGTGAVFAVRGAMIANSCGTNAPSSAATLAFDLELIAQSNTLKWRIPASGIAASTRFDPATASAFRFVDDRVVTLRPADRRSGVAACVLRRLDVIDGRLSGTLLPLDPLSNPDDAGMSVDLDANAPGDASLRADGGDASSPWPALHDMTETVGWAVVSGADCRDFIGITPGQFVTLPCEQRWTFDARWKPESTVSR